MRNCTENIFAIITLSIPSILKELEALQDCQTMKYTHSEYTDLEAFEGLTEIDRSQ